MTRAEIHDESEYLKYLKSDHWKQHREKQIESDGWQCAFCGSKEKLNVHHKNYRHIGEEKVDDDTITLCEQCHNKLHNCKNETRNKTSAIKNKHRRLMVEEISHELALVCFEMLGKRRSPKLNTYIAAICKSIENPGNYDSTIVIHEVKKLKTGEIKC